MNAFRITLLVLLTMVIALMFYAIQVVIPGWQGQYDEYVATQRVNELQQQTEAHRARISQLDPAVDSPEVASARSADAAVARASEQALNEAEEQSVIAAARREEEAKQVREPEKKADTPPAVGQVAAYDAEWGVLLIKPLSAIGNGTVVAVTHEGVLLCEATIDGTDEASGQLTATIKPLASGEVKQAPAAGDAVIISPFMTEADLRKEAGMGTPTPIPAGIPTTPAGGAAPITPTADNPDALPDLRIEDTNGLPEVDATFTPVP